MRPIQPLSLVFGFALAAIVFVSMGQVGVPTSSWGPPKKDIINAWEAGPVIIPPGGSLTVFDVPADRWFVGTGFSVTASYPTAWAEDLNGVVTVKGVTGVGLLPQVTAAPIGWTFRPGSKVVLQNLEPTFQNHIYNRSLLGYLARE